MKKEIKKIKCPICGDNFMEGVTADYTTSVKDSGRVIEILVKDLNRLVCPHCGEEFLPPEALDRIQIEKYKKLDLLTPEELKIIRERLKCSQEEMANLLGVGKKSYFRWENGLSIQNKSMDRYIRLIDKNPDNVFRLKKMQKQEKEHYDKEKIAQYFNFLKSMDTYETKEELVAQVGYKAEIPDELEKKVEEIIKKHLKENKNE